MLLMMTPDGRPTDWDELPIVMERNDLALLLCKKLRTIRRMHQLGDIPSAHNGTWYRDEIEAWISAGQPSREVWEGSRAKKFCKQ